MTIEKFKQIRGRLALNDAKGKHNLENIIVWISRTANPDYRVKCEHLVLDKKWIEFRS